MATLYHYPLCPFSRKVRLLLRERNIDPDLITEAFWLNRKEFLKTNPSGEVPVLIINNQKICGHYAITEFLEEKYEPTFPNDLDKKNECRMESFWMRIEADLLLEGKTLVCVNGDEKRVVSVVCRDNHRNRKYNMLKELYPIAKNGFRLNPKMGKDSPYLELRCYF